MRTTEGALDWLAHEDAHESRDWTYDCERLQRTAWGLAAHFSSAELHAKAIPAAFRHGHELPSRGDLGLLLNGRAGHIVTFNGDGWDCYTNDYGGQGKVRVTDFRNLPSWCDAHSWFVADAWWSNTNFVRTHRVSTPPPVTPAPAPTPELGRKSEQMFLATVKYGSNSASYWVVGPNWRVNVSGGIASTWTGAKVAINDEATWQRFNKVCPAVAN